MKNIKKNKKDTSHTRRENPKRYKSNPSSILHTGATSPGVIARITTVLERRSTGFLTEAMVIVDGITNKGDMVDVLIYKSPGNNIPEGTGWVKEVDKFNNGSTTMSVKLYDNGLLYRNIPLEYVTKFDILNRMYSEPREKYKCFDNLIKKDTNIF